MNYGKLIGKGAFSKVYRKDNENKVTVLTDDNVKECMGNGWFPDTSLFPKVVAIDHDEISTYEMPYYPKVRAPKKELTKRSYELYNALRELADTMPYCANKYDSYEKLHKHIDTIPAKFSKEKREIREAIEALSNYGPDIAFEISPRNISKTARGKLVLLDCFFFKSALQKKYKTC